MRREREKQLETKKNPLLSFFLLTVGRRPAHPARSVRVHARDGEHRRRRCSPGGPALATDPLDEVTRGFQPGRDLEREAVPAVEPSVEQGLLVDAVPMLVDFLFVPGHGGELERERGAVASVDRVREERDQLRRGQVGLDVCRLLLGHLRLFCERREARQGGGGGGGKRGGGFFSFSREEEVSSATTREDVHSSLPTPKKRCCSSIPSSASSPFPHDCLTPKQPPQAVRHGPWSRRRGEGSFGLSERCRDGEKVQADVADDAHARAVSVNRRRRPVFSRRPRYVFFPVLMFLRAFSSVP